MSSTPQTLEEALAVVQQQQAEIERLHKAHEAWMRAVAHDLRAPLRHVLSFAPLLKETVDVLTQTADASAAEAAADAREFATTMEQAARKMGGMLDGMVQVSRAARVPLSMGAVDLVAVSRRVVQSLQERHPKVQWQLPQGMAMVRADEASVQSAMEAVLHNAIKFSAQHAQPQIAVRLQPMGCGDWQWQVQDNGVGFDGLRAQSLGHLFQRMHRETEFAGVGCGLALVAMVAQRHGARWQLQAQPGAGCTFSWVLPGMA